MSFKVILKFPSSKIQTYVFPSDITKDEVTAIRKSVQENLSGASGIELSLVKSLQSGVEYLVLLAARVVPLTYVRGDPADLVSEGDDPLNIFLILSAERGPNPGASVPILADKMPDGSPFVFWRPVALKAKSDSQDMVDVYADYCQELMDLIKPPLAIQPEEPVGVDNGITSTDSSPVIEGLNAEIKTPPVPVNEIDLLKATFDAEAEIEFNPLPKNKPVPFLNKMQTYEMDEHLHFVRKITKKTQWDLVIKLAGSIKGAIQMTPDDVRELYTLQKKYHILTLFYGAPEQFALMLDKAVKRPMDERPKSIKDVKELDTISSRLSQSSEAKCVVLSLGCEPRKGELHAFINIYDIDNPMMYTSKPKVPVALALANEYTIRVFRNYVKKTAPLFVGNIPHVYWLTHDLTSDEISFLADVSYIRDKKDPGTFAIDFNTRGAVLDVGHRGDDAPRFLMDPMAELLGAGLPFIYVLKLVYNYDKNFQSYWDEKFRNKISARQDKHGDEYDHFVETSKDFYGSVFPVAGPSKIAYEDPGLIDAKGEPITVGKFDNAVKEFMHQQRNDIMISLVEQGVFTEKSPICSLMPNDAMSIMMLNDILMNGLNIESYNSSGYFNVGFNIKGNARGRPYAYPFEKKGFLGEKHFLRYDQTPNEELAMVDFRMVDGGKDTPRILFVGDGDWGKKITPSGGSESRSVIYYDYDPEQSEVDDRTGKVRHRTIDYSHSRQYLHAREQFDKAVAGKYKFVGCIVPIGALPLVLERYGSRFKAITKAPYPAEASAYVIVSSELNKFPVNLDHCFYYVRMLQASLAYSLECYMHGKYKFDDLFVEKMEFFKQDYIVKLFSSWTRLMMMRFENNPENKQKHHSIITRDNGHLLRVDSIAEKSAYVQNAFTQMNQGKSSFALQPKKKAKEN